MSEPDKVGTALWSILTSSTTGAAACAAALVAWRLLVLSTHLLPYILIGSLLVAGSLGWFLSRPIADLWRRAVTSAVSVFGTSLLIIGTIVVDLLGQALGLAAYGAILSGAAILGALRVRQSAHPTT